MAGQATRVDRRGAVADAAIWLIARDGLRGLTHRAVDRELSLPQGSTSYYARTRRQLVELVVHRLAERTSADVRRAAPLPTTPDEAAEALARTLDAIAARDADTRARFALAVDLAGDPELHALVTSASPIRDRLLERAEAVLDALGVPDPERHAPDLVALTDGLLYDRLAGPGADRAHRADARSVVRAYLTGLLAG